PILPIEIMEHILALAWHSPTTGSARITMQHTLPLVSHAFLAIYNRLSLTDVHLTSADHCYNYLHALATRPAADASRARLALPYFADANARCRSITFHIPAPPSAEPGGGAVHIYRESDPMGQALSATLARIRELGYVPGLARVAVVYSDWGYNDIFDHNRLLYLPESVHSLELRFAFNASTDPRVIQGLSARYFGRPRLSGWAMPGVRHLRLVGACPDLAIDTAQVCPNVETIELDEVKNLNVLAPLPPTVRKLVLEAP
ncbi:hypothetical protein FA95DRAFT_1461827, partial [Auriscalpium vulgare]